MAGKFEVYKGASDWRFRLKAGNGEIVATGQGCASKDGAKQGCAALQKAAADATVVEVE